MKAQTLKKSKKIKLTTIKKIKKKQRGKKIDFL
jgi:hypothetical protein